MNRSVGMQLPGGASAAEIAEVEALFGYPFPEPLRQLYAFHDGEFSWGSKQTVGLFCGYEFLSLAHVREVLRRFKAIQDHNQPDGYEYASTPAGAVRDSYYERGWLPIAGYFSGNHIGIDMTPGPNGEMGQVINFGPDDFVHSQLAPDFESFLRLLVERYRQRRWHPNFEGDDWSLYNEISPP